LDLDSIWEEATLAEHRILIEDLVDSVHFYPDRLTVQVTGAPPILVTLKEAGLHTGTSPMVSESRREPSRFNFGSILEPRRAQLTRVSLTEGRRYPHRW
jgi:hypothetical protein